MRQGDDAELHLRVLGSGPIEKIDVFNGCTLMDTRRTYGERDLGARLKLVWRGAEVRGRARMSTWDGGLEVRNNALREAEAVNFWNPEHPLERIDEHTLAWRSATTGGCAGVVFSLVRAQIGELVVSTQQRTVSCAVSDAGLVPMAWECGGLDRKLELCRLPDTLPREFTVALPLHGLCPGDNPIFVRVTQEDGHLAWTSPTYLVLRDEAVPQARHN